MRLFVALEPPETVREQIGRRVAAVRGELPAARWVRPEAVHLTLAFLGEREVGSVAALDRALAPVFARFPPLELRPTVAGAFPAGRPPRVLWLGLESGDGLRELQRAVARSAAGVFGEEPEGRPFHPHLTLARLGSRWPRAALERWLGAFRAGEVDAFRARQGTLMESHLTPTGARYRARSEYPLEDPAR